MKVFIYTYQPNIGREHISQQGYTTLKEVQEEIMRKPNIEKISDFNFFSDSGRYRIYEIIVKGTNRI